jgi:hypothetical protein
MSVDRVPHGRDVDVGGGHEGRRRFLTKPVEKSCSPP